jgi:predicted small metal-binding protein
LVSYSFKCQDVHGNFSFDCGFSKNTESRDELWKEIEKHYAAVHLPFSKGDPFGENPKLKTALENAIKENR